MSAALTMMSATFALVCGTLPVVCATLSVLQTVPRDACRVPCNAHSCSTGFLLDQVMTADCCTLGESFVAVLLESVPAQSVLAKPACSCRVWISPIYISEIG